MAKPITYVGLDVHKDTIAVALAEAGLRGEVREHGKIPNTPAALKALTVKLAPARRELRFCYEAGPCGYVIIGTRPEAACRLGHSSHRPTDLSEQRHVLAHGGRRSASRTATRSSSCDIRAMVHQPLRDTVRALVARQRPISVLFDMPCAPRRRDRCAGGYQSVVRVPGRSSVHNTTSRSSRWSSRI